MRFDEEGHIVWSPAELHRGLDDIDHIINRALLCGTPMVFPTYAGYHDFLSAVSDRLGVHPMNICVRGSSKLGFSISPKSDKIWVELNPSSDIDIGIVDADYFHYIERELRRWEHRSLKANRSIWAIRNSRRFFFYRYFDLPEDEIPCVQEHNDCFREIAVESHCGYPRIVTAFIYRDWWSVVGRCRYDLIEVRDGLKRGTFVAGPERPFAYRV
jgi:hypothetical protein